jgi:uncharacterized protein
MLFELNDAVMGLVGGGLIGLSAAVFLLANGRIAGISGIVGNLIGPGSTDMRVENLLFIAGLIGAPSLLAPVLDPPTIGVTGHVGLLVLSGLLVGFGTRMGGGCTSGHGVCGMARVSPRSIVATLVFLTIGIASASALRSPLLSMFEGTGS